MRVSLCIAERPAKDKSYENISFNLLLICMPTFFRYMHRSFYMLVICRFLGVVLGCGIEGKEHGVFMTGKWPRHCVQRNHSGVPRSLLVVFATDIIKQSIVDNWHKQLVFNLVAKQSLLASNSFTGYYAIVLIGRSSDFGLQDHVSIGLLNIRKFFG